MTDFSEAFDSVHQAFLAGRYAGQQERGELFRLLAAGVARKYEEAGNVEMATAAREVCRIIFDLDLKLWPCKPAFSDEEKAAWTGRRSA